MGRQMGVLFAVHGTPDSMAYRQVGGSGGGNVRQRTGVCEQKKMGWGGRGAEGHTTAGLSACQPPSSVANWWKQLCRSAVSQGSGRTARCLQGFFTWLMSVAPCSASSREATTASQATFAAARGVQSAASCVQEAARASRTSTPKEQHIWKGVGSLGQRACWQQVGGAGGGAGRSHGDRQLITQRCNALLPLPASHSNPPCPAQAPCCPALLKPHLVAQLQRGVQHRQLQQLLGKVLYGCVCRTRRSGSEQAGEGARLQPAGTLPAANRAPESPTRGSQMDSQGQPRTGTPHTHPNPPASPPTFIQKYSVPALRFHRKSTTPTDIAAPRISNSWSPRSCRRPRGANAVSAPALLPLAGLPAALLLLGTRAGASRLRPIENSARPTRSGSSVKMACEQ